MDYQALLRKYVEWVRECEGVSYIDSGTHYHHEKKFTSEEWAELLRIDGELDAEGARRHAEWLSTLKR